jgi:hypothetical protein
VIVCDVPSCIEIGLGLGLGLKVSAGAVTVKFDDPVEVAAVFGFLTNTPKIPGVLICDAVMVVLK